MNLDHLPARRAVTAAEVLGSTTLTRRSTLQGVAAVSLFATARRGSRTRTTLPSVTPLSSQKMYEGYGVCAHPTFRTTAYAQVDAWVSRLASMGVRYFRGEYRENNVGTASTVAACRKYGVKWVMLVADFDAAPTATAATVAHIARNAADVCIGIEGLNEPNGSSTGSDWAVTTVAHQKAIWETASACSELGGVCIIGPSLHGMHAWRSYYQTDPVGGPRHYHQLLNAGLLSYMRRAGMHHYSGGEVPVHNLASRIDLLHSAYGSRYPIWLTETGYHNALSTTSSNRPVDEATAATYGPRGLLQTASLGLNSTRYELLDDPDPLRATFESNFGLWRVGSNVADDPETSWVAKPEVTAMSALLASLRDDGPAYTPKPVGLAVKSPVSDVKHVVTQNRAGASTLRVWRDLSVWDTTTRTPRAVSPTTITVTDRLGARQVTVGAKVVNVTVR